MMEPSELFPLTLPPDDAMLRAIGLVAVQWGYLEYEIDQEIKGLLAHPKNAGTKFSFRSYFTTRTATWRKLARAVYDTDLADRVDDISSRANTIKRRRDAIVHGVYGDGSEGVSLAVFRFAEMLDYQPTSVGEIERLAAEISVIGADMLRHVIARGERYAETPPDPHLERS